MRTKHTLTGAGHGDGVAVGAVVVFLAAAVQGALVVGDAVRRTLWALRVSQCRLVEARPAHWGQRERRREHHADERADERRTKTQRFKRLAAILLLIDEI